MAIQTDMTWDSKKNRWQKLYKGKLYRVTCFALKAPETKEGSYRAANDWWKSKRAEIDGQSKHPHHDVLDELDRRIAWARQHALEVVAEDTTIKRQIVQSIPDADRESVWEIASYGSAFGDNREFGNHVPTDNTVHARVDEYLALRLRDAQAGQIKPSTYKGIKDRLPHFQKFAGGLDASKVDEQILANFHGHLTDRVATKEMSPQYAAHLLSQATSFTRWLWRSRIIENLPRNLENLSIRVPLKEIETFTVEEVRHLIDNASDLTKLYIILMLNCGMYQSDIASIKPSQVDWERGRIVRKRTKADNYKDAPKVDYLLWSETFRLLKMYGRKDGELAIVNENGNAVYRREIGKDGKVGNVDNVKKCYDRLCEKLGIKDPKPLMYLRKTSSSLLEGHKDYGRFSQYFLGQSPQGVTERRYAKPSPEQFDAAVGWLGEQYGF